MDDTQQILVTIALIPLFYGLGQLFALGVIILWEEWRDRFG